MIAQDESLSEEERLLQTLERERRARREAEAIAEEGTRQLYERGRQMELLYLIADASSRADSVEVAIQVALDELCAYTGWPIGHAFTVTNDTIQPLISSKRWHLDQVGQFAPFRAVSDSIRFDRGIGLPGRVLERGETVWIADVTLDDNFPRQPQAKAIGLRGAFAIPVLAGNRVVTVLEFFSREEANPTQPFLELMNQVGIQVGRTFERQEKDAAERANRAKSEFLSRMSHELRTPLNAILGFGQLLAMDFLSSDQRDGVAHILKGGQHLLNLVNEMLDISRIESGKMQLSYEPVHVHDVLSETLDLVGPLAAKREISVSSSSEALGDRHVLADRQRFKQVLLNLLSNAIKYNRHGGSVSVECRESEGRIRLSFTDTGLGIPTHRLPQLFVAFERLGAEYTEVEGTGLGLALSKKLIEMMRGSIGVHTVPEVGSTFWVELAVVASPLEANGDATLVPEVPDNGPEILQTVLYIEDNLSNLRLIERVITKRHKVKLLSAMQAGMGIDLAVQHQPALILLDLNLPDMSGLDALALLRKDPRTSSIPVVIISADATTHQVERLLAAGANEYLTKPLDLPKFLRTIDKALTDTAAGVTAR